MFVTIVMTTLVFTIFMLLVIMFIVYFDYILSIASLCISLYSARSGIHRVSGQHCVSMVLIHCLPMDAPYILRHVIDRECDILVGSFVVHSPNVGQVGSSYEGGKALFLISLSNIPYV